MRLQEERKQYVATFFLRNRAELEQIRLLLNRKAEDSRLDVAVLACSKGAEVYSIASTIRSARRDLKLNILAVDISSEILEFAERGVYSLSGQDGKGDEDVASKTNKDQPSSIFERMTSGEMKMMFAIEGDQAMVKPWLKEGIKWLCGDASDPGLVDVLGPQDIVVANRFLCHMQPEAAESCLRNIARMVKPGGYLFVSGIDLDVRTKVAQDMGWKPVAGLVREIYEGDPSLQAGWPLEYWGLEPFRRDRSDWQLRYASVFQVGKGH